MERHGSYAERELLFETRDISTGVQFSNKSVIFLNYYSQQQKCSFTIFTLHGKKYFTCFVRVI